jgi:hypothetical protein
VRLAGFGELLADVRLRQAVHEYVSQRLGGVGRESVRSAVVEAVSRMLVEREARSPQAVPRPPPSCNTGVQSTEG